MKEVERLEKNREQRRARIAETREEKRTMMKKDPGNLNWEFSAMIKYCHITFYISLQDGNKYLQIYFAHFHTSN